MSLVDRTVPVLVAVAAALLAYAAAGHLAAPRSPAPGSPPPPAGAPAGDGDVAGAAGPGASRAADPAADSPIGLCNGIGNVPLALQPSYDFSRYDESLRADVAQARAVGAAWYRHNTVVYPYFDEHTLGETGWDWTQRDKLVRSVQEGGMDLLLVLGRTQGNANCENERMVWHAESYAPRTDAEREAYVDYVKRVVERYDGDGVDDAPGLLRPVKWWELDNEVDLHHGRCKEMGRDWQSPEDYFALLKLTREASREADPESRLIPGFAAMEAQRHAVTPDQWIQRLFAIEGGKAGEWIDALNYHDYTQRLDHVLDRVDWLQRVAGRPLPVWITEIGLPSDEAARPGWTWDRQADEMVRFTLRLLASGKVGKVFWYTLEDAPRRTGDPRWRAFGTCGLWSCEGGPELEGSSAGGDGPGRRGGGKGVRGDGGGREGAAARRPGDGAGGRRVLDPAVACPQRNLKPAGRAFARLADALAGMKSVEPLPEIDGYRIRRDSAPDVVVAWSPPGERRLALGALAGAKTATVFPIYADPARGREAGRAVDGEVTLGPRPAFFVLDR
ncbi:glycosyl hydrolase [Myxococcota bacterium]|nr:glycosyl hydrolase [Myxococcota bacterium]